MSSGASIAAEGTIHTVTMITRKPPKSLKGAPYLAEHGICIEGLDGAMKVFEGSAREGGRGFPANVNVAAALGLAVLAGPPVALEIEYSQTDRPIGEVHTACGAENRFRRLSPNQRLFGKTRR